MVAPSNAQGCLADCPAMSFVLVCWHSRKWWPPIRGGLLHLLVLWLDKLIWIDFFCKIGIFYAWGGPWSIKRGKMCKYTREKKQFFPEMWQPKWGIPRQIKIQIQISWVGRSTKGCHGFVIPQERKMLLHSQTIFIKYLSVPNGTRMQDSRRVRETEMF